MRRFHRVKGAQMPGESHPTAALEIGQRQGIRAPIIDIDISTLRWATSAHDGVDGKGGRSKACFTWADR